MPSTRLILIVARGPRLYRQTKELKKLIDKHGLQPAIDTIVLVLHRIKLGSTRVNGWAYFANAMIDRETEAQFAGIGGLDGNFRKGPIDTPF